MGWVVQRNAAVYAEEFGWDSSYEALVARIVADYVDHRDPEAEAAWIAEVEARRPAVCSACARTPPPRGCDCAGGTLGQGPRDLPRLVEEVLRFARYAGYSHITLSTNDVLADPDGYTSGPASPWTTRAAITASGKT